MVQVIFRYVLLKNNSSEIWHLQQRREVTKQNLIESEQTTKNLILQLAEQTRQLIELGGISIPIDHISSYISEEMREAGWTEGQLAYIRECLPKDYKNSNLSRFGEGNLANSVYDRTDELVDNLTEEIIDQLSDTSLKLAYQKKKDKTSERRRRDHLTLELLKEKAAQRNIVLENEDKIEGMHFLTPEENPWYFKAEHISTVLSACARIHENIKNKALDAPPQDSERMTELINDITIPELYFILHKNWYTPIGDEKWSFDLYTWGKIVYNYTEQGKHAAAKSRGLAKVPLSVYGIPEDRGLTREQVGDRFKFVFNRWVQMAQTIQVIMQLEPNPNIQSYEDLVKKGYTKDDLDLAFQNLFNTTSIKMQQYPLFRHFITIGEKWHYPEQTPMIAHRKYRMHDKLSELA